MTTNISGHRYILSTKVLPYKVIIDLISPTELDSTWPNAV